MSHFDLPGLRYPVAKAQNGIFGDRSHTVWPAMQAISVKMVNFIPTGTVVSMNLQESYGGLKKGVANLAKMF